MKNIILIITDTFRYDNLQSKTQRPVRTPELDQFMDERATSIEKFYAGSFPTIPHRTDLATSQIGWPHYPWQHINSSSSNHIAKMLADCGYNTQLICDCPHLFPAGFQLAFDAAFQNRGQEGDVPLLHFNDPIESMMPMHKTRLHPLFKGKYHLADKHRWTNRYYVCEEDTFSSKTARTTIRWLEENYQVSPFFLWVDFFDPHEPWDPPEYFVRHYDPDYQGIPMIHPNYGRSSAYTDAELHNLWAHYAAESELVDRAIGRILQKIDDLHLWDESIVVITSDHGFSIGEHERTGKSNISKDDSRYWPIYPEVAHVPFLIAGPGISAEQRLDIIAQPVDILPTLCELATAEINPEEPLEGKSFVRTLYGQTTTHRDYATAGSFLSLQEPKFPEKETIPFLITQKWGYTPCGPDGQPELYQLTEDPLAETNIIQEYPQIAKDLHTQLRDFLKEHNVSEYILQVLEQ